MAGLIKNQILKHLSRYAKNLSSDKINLSTFKGEGELRNLELDQEVMTELLSLPTWMKLTHATCNHVLIRIPWTKLKSVPIHLSLDEVNIRVEACEELRTGNENNPMFPPPAFGKYGFVNKVIDGITATVNSVEITFHSREFESKVQISRIRVESRSPEWKRCELSGTRLKDLTKGETLIFKEMEWQTLRLEARSTLDRHLAPLRLLANQAKARIVIKKSLNNSEVVGCRLSLILDDLLWVLTDSQILAALHFMSSLSGLVKQATETTQRMKAARKLESLPEYQAQISQTNAVESKIMLTRFDVHDVRETSYHFNCEKIDLHFCDDPGSGRSRHPDLKDGGALQLSLNQVMADFYPYHLAIGSRKFWHKYAGNTLAQWLQQALKNFKISLIDALSSGSLHTPLSRTNPASGGGASKSVFEPNPVKDEIAARLGKLMSSCLIVKIHDMSLFRVTTSSKRTSPLPFISTFIERPKELPVIHTEFTWFYYPGEICFPLPSAKIYAYLHPIQIQLDVCTILWLNSFLSNLGHSMAEVAPQEDPDYVDVRVEMLMPKIIFENPFDYPGQTERPNSLHIQVSRLILSNYRSAETGTYHHLTQCIELLQRGDLIYGSNFPSRESDVPLLQEKFVNHAEGRDKLRPPKKLNSSSFTEISGDLTKDLLWTEPRDVWFIQLDPCWADFHVEEKRKRLASESGSVSSKKIFNKPGQGDARTVNTVIYPFIDAIPVTVWVYVNEKDTTNSKLKQKNIHAALSVGEMLKVQLTHLQFLFLMRMVEALGEMSLYLTLDSKGILGDEILKNVVTVVGYVKAVEVSLLFPPSIQDKNETPSMEFNGEETRIPVSHSHTEGEFTSHKDGEKIEGQGFSPQSIPFLPLNKPFFPHPLSASQMTRNLGGGSNPNLGSHPGNGFPGMSYSVKHSLTNLSVTFNKCGGVATPDSEVVSNWSNVSSDSSDNFVQLDVGEKELGSVTISSPSAARQDDGETDSEIEVAVEMEENSFVDERCTPSPLGVSQDVSTSRAEHDNITSVLTILLQGIEIGQEGHGLSSTIKLQSKSVGIKELPEISWKDFQDKFCGRKRSSAENENRTLVESSNPTQRRAIKLRLDQNINADKFMGTMSSDEVVSISKEITSPASPRINLSDRPGAASPIRNAITEATSANLLIEVDFTNEAQIKLHTSSCTALADLLEDEILPTPIPLNVDLVGVNIELTEDRPPANITSPGPVPLKIDIPFLNVSRDAAGVLKLGPSYDPSGRKFSIVLPNPDVGSSQAIPPDDSEKDFLRQELEKTTLQLQQYQLRNSALEEEREENECLKGLIVSLQDEVHKLQTEKSELLRRYQHNYH